MNSVTQLAVRGNVGGKPFALDTDPRWHCPDVGRHAALPSHARVAVHTQPTQASNASVLCMCNLQCAQDNRCIGPNVLRRVGGDLGDPQTPII